MALNKIERELLVAARELIESGEEYFLCFAIASATPSIITTRTRQIASIFILARR